MQHLAAQHLKLLVTDLENQRMSGDLNGHIAQCLILSVHFLNVGWMKTQSFNQLPPSQMKNPVVIEMGLCEAKVKARKSQGHR